MKNFLLLFILLTVACSDNKTPAKNTKTPKEITNTFNAVNKKGNTIKSRFNLPNGFKRTKVNEYGNFLRNIRLKPDKTKVFHYDGSIKSNNVHEGVIDLDIGKRDLQQCADAVMRLRAEYLYANQKFDEIHFNFTNGFKCDYNSWRTGKRVAINGNKTWWESKTTPNNSYASFRKYLDQVYMYAGTASLAKELKAVNIEKMQIGDVFIRGGHPGHAIMIVDMAENPKTGEKLFMLAQSYMPAQSIHILKNPNNYNLSPWYKLSEIKETLITPEWIFTRDELKRF